MGLNTRDGNLCNRLRSSVDKNVVLSKGVTSHSNMEFVDSLEFYYSKCLIGNDTAFIKSVLGRSSDILPPSLSSENFKELKLKYSLEYVFLVQKVEQQNPVLYFGVDSMNIVKCVKRGFVITKISN